MEDQYRPRPANDVEKANDDAVTLHSNQMPLEGEASEPLDSDQRSMSTAVTSRDASIQEEKEKYGREGQEPFQIPEERGGKIEKYIRFDFFTSYRKSFAVIFTANMAAFLALLIRDKGDPYLPDVGTACSANIMTCILFRQENFVNLVYEIFTCAPKSLPVSIRKRLAKVFHYGGMHSGCGTAAVAWYMLYTALATKMWTKIPTRDTLANLITSWILVTMFICILSGAHPKFRVKFHDYFEAAHRFSGWVALATFWVHTYFSTNITATMNGESFGKTLVSSPNFWFISVSTSCTILSWSRLRHIPVYTEVLSDHATRLHFKYRQMPPFYGLKVSSRPVFEWHAFATIPDEDGGFSVVVSNAGDWTKHIIRNPPEKLWVRGYPLHGLLYTSKLFRRIVVVATGSGIGPCLSLLYADITPRRVFWSTPKPLETYGAGIIKAVKKADPNAVVWDTRSQGRPDMVKEVYQVVRESDAEAVFIISNPKVTHKVVYGMETRGIPAYGAIFDS